MTLLHAAKSKEQRTKKDPARPMKRKKPEKKAQTLSSSDSDSTPQKQIPRNIRKTEGEGSSGTTSFPTIPQRKATLAISSSDEGENDAMYLDLERRGIIPNARRQRARALEDTFSPLEKLKRAMGTPKPSTTHKGKELQKSPKKH